MAAPAAAATLTVDLDAVAANYRLLVERMGGKPVAAVVKANAYGLGAAQVAPVLWRAGCRLFFTAQLAEALALRPVLPPSADIAVLNGLAAGEAELFAAERLWPVLNDLAQLERWRAYCAEHEAAGPAVLHIDTGMSRLGLEPTELERLAASPDLLRGVDLRLVMSHMACADTPAHPKNREQLAAFRAALAGLEAPLAGVPRSLAASSALFLGPEFRFDVGRPGAAIYGLKPQEDTPNPLRCTVRLTARILQVRRVDSPMTVGYGAAHSVPGPGTIATVGVGYADGFLRSAGGRSVAGLGGHRVPLVGRISMDLITLDVSDVPTHLVHPDATVELIGEAFPPDDLASAAGTIGYEILTSLGARYTRRYVGGGAA